MKSKITEMLARTKEKDGYITATTMLMFLCIIVILTSLAIVVTSNWKASSHTATNDSSYYYATYGQEKAQSAIIDFIKNAPASDRKLYKKDMNLLAEDINEELISLLNEEALEDENFSNVEVTVESSEDHFLLTSTSTVPDKLSSLTHRRTVESKLTYVPESLGDYTFEMPKLDAAIVSEEKMEFIGGDIKGKVIILNPSPGIVHVKNSFGGLKDSVIDGHTTTGRILVYSKGGKYNYNNVHEIFDFQGLPFDTKAAEFLFNVARRSNGEGYIVSPKLDKIEIINEDYTLPRVRGIKDYSHINKKASPYTLKAVNGGKDFTMVDGSGNLKFPSSAWEYTSGSTITYELRENAYYPSIDLAAGWITYELDVGDRNIEIVVDKLTFMGNIKVKGTGSLTIYVSQKNLKDTNTAKNNIKINPSSLSVDGNSNKRLSIALDTPDSMKNTPFELDLSGWSGVAFSIMAEHLKLTVTGTIDVNALSWGPKSSATIKSSSSFNSNLFYFREGIINFETKYYYGTIIAKKVNMSNTSPTIEMNDKDAPTFDGFPLEVDWENVSGQPSTGAPGDSLGEPNVGILKFSRPQEVS